MKEEKYNLRDIFALYFTLDRIFFREFRSRYQLENMNFTHFRAMMLLIVEGSSSMTQLSEKMNLEKGSLTSVANHLHKLGYVKKVKDEKDKRVYTLKATDKGREFSEVVIGDHLEYINEKIEGFSEQEKDMYLSGAKFLVSMMNKLEN